MGTVSAEKEWTARVNGTAHRVMRNMFGATFMADPARAVFGFPENTREMLGQIHVPTLLVAGDNPPASGQVTWCSSRSRTLPPPPSPSSSARPRRLPDSQEDT